MWTMWDILLFMSSVFFFLNFSQRYFFLFFASVLFARGFPVNTKNIHCFCIGKPRFDRWSKKYRNTCTHKKKKIERRCSLLPDARYAFTIYSIAHKSWRKSRQIRNTVWMKLFRWMDAMKASESPETHCTNKPYECGKQGKEWQIQQQRQPVCLANVAGDGLYACVWVNVYRLWLWLCALTCSSLRLAFAIEPSAT